MLSEENNFRSIFHDLIYNGIECSPRGLRIIELENYSYELKPYQRFCNFRSRKLNLNYIKQEFLWYLRGNAKDLSILNHAKMWKGLVTDNGIINSNYGHYIFGLSMFYNVANELIRDKDSRRASIVILNNGHLTNDYADVPCTYALNFRIRQNRLNMSVMMRSQDSIYGMGNDAPSFSFIHEMMFEYLKDTYKDLEYGNYFHYVNSFHAYEKHFKMLEKIVYQMDDYVPIKCHKINGKKEVEFLLKNNFNKIPKEFAFTRWLNS